MFMWPCEPDHKHIIGETKIFCSFVLSLHYGSLVSLEHSFVSNLVLKSFLSCYLLLCVCGDFFRNDVQIIPEGFFYWFYSFERERVRVSERASVQEGGGAEAKREEIPSWLHAKCRPRGGAPSPNPEITIQAKIKSWRLNQLSHPGAPIPEVFSMHSESPMPPAF